MLFPYIGSGKKKKKEKIKEPVRGTINRDKAKYSRGIIGNLHFNVNHTV